MMKSWVWGIATVMVTLSTWMGLAQDIEIPRTTGGRPDLQGIWTNKTLTPLTRPREFAETPALNQEQVQRLEGDNQVYLDAEYANSDPDRKSTRLNSSSRRNLVCLLPLEKKNTH